MLLCGSKAYPRKNSPGTVEAERDKLPDRTSVAAILAIAPQGEKPFDERATA
jgi:hypothetical protein